MAAPDATAAAVFTLQGNLFISAQIERIFAQKAREQSDKSYGLAKGENLKNKIATAYNICVAEWRDFKAQMERTDLSAEERAASVERFAVRLFQHGLGYNEPSAVGSITLADSTDPDTQLVYPVKYVIYQTSAQAKGMEKLPLVVVPPVTDNNERSDLDTKLTSCAVVDVETQRAAGEKKRSPTGLLQRLLNVAADYKWGFAFNGYALRLQREAVSLSGLNYAEFNLESIFARESQAEFARLYLMLHVSRSRVDAAGNNVWEQWRQECREVGQPAREKLSQSLSDAMETLGNGFLQWHQPFTSESNEALKAKLRSGELTAADFNQQLIRLVYRLLFIFCLEERDCLLTTVPSAGQSAEDHQEARQRYLEGYALKRFVPQVLKTYFYEDDYADAWDSVRIVLKGLSQGEPRLALPALGGLFKEEQCADLVGAKVSNSVFYETMRLLRYAELDKRFVLIDYRNIDTEEFGSMYEGLLELVPEIKGLNGVGQLAYKLCSLSGNERKSSGSYYTPDELVQSLIHTALDPVIESKLKANPQEPEQALLSLKVIDPTCGSGHFLLAAARRIAKHLEEVRAHGGEVSLSHGRSAPREPSALVPTMAFC